MNLLRRIVLRRERERVISAAKERVPMNRNCLIKFFCTVIILQIQTNGGKDRRKKQLPAKAIS
jgi:hypothetical protein